MWQDGRRRSRGALGCTLPSKVRTRQPLSFLFLLLAAAAATGVAAPTHEFEIAGIPVVVEGELGSFTLDIETKRLAPGLEVATLRLTSSSPAVPPALALSWSIPAHDVAGQWNTAARFNKGLDPDWGPSRVRSMLARNAPVMALFGSDDGNRMTFAVSDALNAVDLSAGLREEDARVYAGVSLFTEPHRAVQQLVVRLRLDMRRVALSRALGDVSRWWQTLPGFEPAAVPEPAREPLYSTWYSYHQSVDGAALLRELDIAKPLGFDAIIIDDGWQTLDSNRGYAYTGDWQPERIPDMKAFVDAVHARDVKLLLWYSVPLVGERSATYPRFAGKYLRYWDGQGAWVLDPRYPEVRAHIIDTYRSAMRDWGVDGFKLDFLGFFTADDTTVLSAEDGRDYASVNEATDRLMTDILTTLRSVHPDVMIEFRQPYIGPLMRKYGNMFRAGDSPNAAVDNRVRIVDLRLLSGNTAVHSDMFVWHYGEAVEGAALQILNILFAVPQLSVRLGDIPEDHREMVAFWTSYWRQNRAVLLEGDFRPHGIFANYPMIEAEAGGKRIVAVYQPIVVAVPSSIDALDVVNATAANRVVLDVATDLGVWNLSVRDTRGNLVTAGSVRLTGGAHALDVPPSGLLSLWR